MEFGALLRLARQRSCSDVHVTENSPVSMRIHGRLMMDRSALDPADARAWIESLCDSVGKKLPENGDMDFSCQDENGRYRANVYRTRTGVCAAVRLLQSTMPTLESLSLPPVLKELCHKPNGLVLVTGPTGSGKSTTLAAMIDYISRVRAAHIITIEDPVEYVFGQNLSLIHQREVGADVGSFADALRSALREDPDILLVGEMRDCETIQTAVTAAETGHLVISTLHTTGVANTIDRMVDAVPGNVQSQLRSQLSMVLEGVITQQLLPIITGDGRTVATEVLLGTDAVRNLIRENKSHQLQSAMQSGGAVGMHTMNSDLSRLVKTGRISKETAMGGSNDKRELLGYL